MVKPLVSCICLTRKRPAWLALAIEYFQAQMFKDAELVIILDKDDQTYNEADQWDFWNKDELQDNIRAFRIARPGTLGEKRNIACEKANGQIVAVWDDDDYNAPTRLHDQLLTLKRTGASVTAYNKMKFTDGHTWWLYDGIMPNIGIGGSLMFTKVFWSRNNFPHQNEGEDNNIVSRAWNIREYIATKACAENTRPGYETTDHMVATIHPANTSKRDTRPGAGGYVEIGQKYAPGCVIDAFRAVGAVFAASAGGRATEPPGANSVRTQ